ncbi:MAG TPA: hypothetical protein LFV66_06175 [Rickettsia endosymbiont of Bembidion lapponicum]|nr:hypothetical protein [Rickettsia endosymbiont of Bembidion lapponicum]
MKEKLTKEKVDRLKNIMEAQEAKRRAEYLREEKEANIIKEESVSLENTYDSEVVATMLSIINEYMPPYAREFKENATKGRYYLDAGHELFNEGDYQTAMFAYKKAFECGNIKYESGKTHFDLNFDVEPFLAIGNVFEIEEQYDKAMAFYNKAIKQKDNFKISESTTVMFENQLDYYNKSLAKALLLKKLKAIDEALQNLDEAIKYNKFSCVAYWEKTNILKEAGQFDKAIAVYDELMTHERNMSDNDRIVTETYHYKAQLLKIMGKNEEAIVNFDEFITSDKGYLTPKNISLQDAYWEKAEALDNLNKTGEANYCKGLALYYSEETNDHKESIVFFDEALKYAKEADNIFLYNFYKGCSLVKLQQEFEANECFNNAEANAKHQNIQIFLQAFTQFNSQIIERQFSEINIDDLVKKRESFIQDFTKRVLLKLNKPASDNYIDKELEFLTKQLGELNSSLSSEINEINQVTTSDLTESVPSIGEDTNMQDHHDIN